VENIFRVCNAMAFLGAVIGEIVARRKSFFAPWFAVMIFGKLDVFLSRFAETLTACVRRGKRAQIALFVCTEERRVAFLLL
jgi:hypothetical protein